MNDREVAKRMEVIRTTDIYNVNLIASSPEHSSRKEEDAVDLPDAVEDDECLIQRDDMRPTHVEIQRMNESTLQIFE